MPNLVSDNSPTRRTSRESDSESSSDDGLRADTAIAIAMADLPPPGGALISRVIPGTMQPVCSAGLRGCDVLASCRFHVV